MKVTHYCDVFSQLTTTFIYEYITELESQGVDNHVATFERRNEKERPFPQVDVLRDVSRWDPRRLFYRALVPFGIGDARSSDWSLKRNRLRQAIQRIDPDVIHAHFGPQGVRAAPVAKQMGLPLVVTFYGYDISSLANKPFWREKYEEMWQSAEAVTVLSEEMKEAARKLGCPSEKLKIVHLSRDLEQFPFRPPDRSVQNVLFVGRLTPKKAPLDAIRAIENANNQGADLEMDMIGDGPLREKVVEYVHEQGLTDVVTVHGRVESDKVNTWMQEADAFLLPSKTALNGDKEGTPTVLVEAQAVGLPCISTHHAGIPEMIPEDNHDLLVSPGDVEKLSERLHALSRKSVAELSRVAERGRQKVEQDFNISDEMRVLKKIYKKIKCTY